MIFDIITLLHRNTRNSSMKYGSFLPGIPHLNYIRMTHRWCNGYRDYLDTVLCNKIKKKIVGLIFVYFSGNVKLIITYNCLSPDIYIYIYNHIKKQNNKKKVN